MISARLADFQVRPMIQVLCAVLTIAGLQSGGPGSSSSKSGTAADVQLDDAQVLKRRGLRRERDALYKRLADDVRDARLKTVKEFLLWLPERNYPDAFKQELERRARIAQKAADFAWRDALRLSDRTLLTGGPERVKMFPDLLRALQLAGRAFDGQDLCIRFAAEASLKSKPREPAAAREYRLCQAVERMRLVEDRAGAERVVAQLAAEPKPVDKTARYWRHRLYMEAARLHERWGDSANAEKAERLADELQSRTAPNLYQTTKRAVGLLREHGLQGALERARKESFEIEQAVLAHAIASARSRERLAEAETAFWAFLPRFKDARPVKVDAVSLAQAYLDLDDRGSAERVLRTALQTSPIVCRSDAAERFFVTYDASKRDGLLKAEPLAPLLLELAAASTLTAKEKADVQLDVAFVKAVLGRGDEARRLAAEAGRVVDRAKDSRFGFVEFFTTTTAETWRDVERWLEIDWPGVCGTGLDELLEWGPPVPATRELLRRIEKIEPSDTVADFTLNRYVALLAADLGLMERATAAIRGHMKDNAAHTAELTLECDLDEFGWEAIQSLPFDDRRPVRVAAAANLATWILGYQLGLDRGPRK
jgi:hypothetical protein